MAIEEKKFLGTAGVQQLITNVRAEISAAEAAAKKHADDLGVNYDAAGTAATKVQELADGQVKTNTEHIGTMDNLETTAKGDLVTAINEVRNAVSAGGTAAAITMTEETTGLGEGVLKAYVLKQGDNTVGTINIPKDMVVQSGEVVVDPEGQAAGTYIKLVLANATNDVIYVNVGTLVDIYKAKASAAQVQIAIDSATREISASIVAGSITATELAADSVVTVKIADGNVTKAKLSTEVQASLDKADSAHSDVATIKADYLKAADKTELNEAITAEADRAKGVEEDFETRISDLEGTYVDSDQFATLSGNFSDFQDYVIGYEDNTNGRLEALEAVDHEHSNKAKLDTYDKTQAELLAAAKAEAEGLIDGVDLSGIATNAADIDKLEASLAEGGATALAIADAKKAGTDASAHADELNTAMNTRVEALEAIDHDHANKAELDLIATGDKAKWDAAAEKAHEHSNKTQLDSYDKTQTELLAAAKTEAESYADGLNTAMNTRVEALESVTYVEITAAEVNALFENGTASE